MKKALVYAFLFNANSINYSSLYSRDIEKLIWNCGILQSVNKAVTIYRGDILALSFVKNMTQLQQLALTLFSNMNNSKKAIYVLLYENVYAWTIDNLENKEVREINEKLSRDVGYLGYVEVNEKHSLHKIFYIDLLKKDYIIQNKNISICVDCSEQDEYLEEISFLKSYGFEQVELREDNYEY